MLLRLVDFIYNAKENLVEWNESRQTRKALSQLSAAQLEDIGLTAEDIAKLSQQSGPGAAAPEIG